MRDHYVGDITDFLKFALLRVLRQDGRRLGIGWYYVPGCDRPNDGRHFDWRSDPRWAQFDPELHSWLSAIVDGERAVSNLEDRAFWGTETQFHGIPLLKNTPRATWAGAKRAALQNSQLIFLDPDNGIRDGSIKHASLDELRALRAHGRTIVFISFPNRSAKHELQVERLHAGIRTATGSAQIMTLRTSISVRSHKNEACFVPRQR